MKNDVIDWASGRKPSKGISKETLNHRGLIELVSGLDVYRQTPESYRRAYQALGIDVINRVPMENAPQPTPEGHTGRHSSGNYDMAPLGVYDTVCRRVYPCKAPEEVWNLDTHALGYSDLLVPVPHGCDGADIRTRHGAIGEVGLYYPLHYTTLFMWGVEVLGWEMFLLTATDDSVRFHDHFIIPCAEKSRKAVDAIVSADDSPFVFLHDDLASGMGPVFRPDWYDEFIFPHYPDIFRPAKEAGRKIIFVADGNMTQFLEKLVCAGVDGLMFENPATPLDSVVDSFGGVGQFLIGGIDTALLTTGTPQQVKAMVYALVERMKNCPGFAMASCGGLHGNIPLANLEAYFDARADVGFTPSAWRSMCHA